MRLRIRFSCFFIIGLLSYILYMGFIMMVFFDGILPCFGISSDNLVVFLGIFLLTFLNGGVLFAFFFVNPLLFMLSQIRKLIEGDYELTGSEKEIFNRKMELKKRYFLYKEVIKNLYNLGDTLNSAKTAEKELEEAKRNWISGVSHDLKTPLSYIIGYSALLQNSDYNWSEEEKQNFLSEINSKGKDIEGLINDLNLSIKMETLESSLPLNLQTFDIIPFLQRLIADVANDPRSLDYELSLQNTVQSLTICADEKLLYRAVQNLLINAVKHNPKGTHINSYLTKTKDEQVLITITDDGIGIQKNEQTDIFTKYHSTSNKNSQDLSSGLGLVIVKNIMDAHHGKITVESSPGRGTTFHLVLPVHII